MFIRSTEADMTEPMVIIQLLGERIVARMKTQLSCSLDQLENEGKYTPMPWPISAASSLFVNVIKPSSKAPLNFFSHQIPWANIAGCPTTKKLRKGLVFRIYF